MIVDEYRIERVAQGCAGCARVFVVEEVYFSTIEDGEQCFQRRDYCSSCWTEENSKISYSHWKTRVPRPEKNLVPRLDLQRVRDFFGRLNRSSVPRHQEMAYVLALILLRKKKLRFADDALLKRVADERAKALEEGTLEQESDSGSKVDLSFFPEAPVTAPEPDQVDPDPSQAEEPAPVEEPVMEEAPAPAGEKEEKPEPPEAEVEAEIEALDLGAHETLPELELVDIKALSVFQVPVPAGLGDEKIEELNEELLNLLSQPLPEQGA